MINKIAVIGIGGVGGYFGGRLCTTNTPVTFVARGEHGAAIATHGLQVRSINGDFKAKPHAVVPQISQLNQPDLVLLGVKSWQVAEVAQALKPVLHPNSMVIPLQNGANNVSQLLKYLPEKQVLGGLSRIISKISAPGCVHHFAYHPHLIVGELNGSISPRLKAIGTLFANAQIDHKLSQDIDVDIWTKYLFITTISGIGALTRAEMGVLRQSEFLYQSMKDTAQEILAVAQAKGIGLTQQIVDQIFEAIDQQDPNTTASMQRDIMEGKPSELEHFNGYIVQQGKQLGIPTPVNDFIYYSLLPMEQQVRNSL